MPLLFLADTDLERYATFPQTLEAEELNRHFVLGPQDLALILERRRDYNRLGFAVQLCTLRALGTFLESPLKVPDVVLRTLARQIGMVVPRDLKRYTRREMTLYKHHKLILNHLGYGAFDKFENFRITRWMYRKLLIGDVRPLELFEEAVFKLRDRRVALPAASTLARLVVRVRERASQKAELAISRRLSAEQVLSLESLLLVPEGERKSNLDLLRRAPVRPSAPSLIAALERIEKLRALKLDGVDLSDLPYGRIKMRTGPVGAALSKTMSRQGMTVWAYTISQWGPLKRQATLLATVQHLLGRSLSDVLDVFERLMHQLGLNGHHRWLQFRLRNLKDLDESVGLLGKAMKLLLEWTKKRPVARDKVLEQFGEAQLKEAVLQVEKLTTGADVRDSEVWLSAQNSVWNFFSRFIKVVVFEGTPVNSGLLEAVTFLQSDSWHVLDWDKAPRGFVPRSWKTLVYDKSTGRPSPEGAVQAKTLNAKTYVLCVAQQLYLALKARAVYVPLSLRHRNPRAGLLEGEMWEAKRVEIARDLNMPLQAKSELERLEAALDSQYLQTLSTLSTNTVLRMEKTSSSLQPIMTPLEALEISPSLRRLQTEVTRRMPKIDLSELVLEVNAYTGFAKEFIVLNDSKNAPTTDPDLELSVCAVLVAQACNISLGSVVKPDVPALTLKRLMHVQQNYIRNDTLMRANAKLVEAHSGLPIVRHWGQGEVASVDGLRFVVPVQSLHRAPNRKYFGAGRGITYLSITSDQYSGLGGTVIPGTVRDSLYILSTLLEQNTTLAPKEIMTDTASYSDIIFGLFHLLGYRFAPRIADLKNTRFWRMDSSTDYGELNKLAGHKVNTTLIAEHWDDLLRLAGSLKLGTVQAPDILLSLTRGKTPTGLGRAAAELGRIAKTRTGPIGAALSKTLHLLEYIQDEDYRRRILIQLNRGELRNSLQGDSSWSTRRGQRTLQRGTRRPPECAGTDGQCGGNLEQPIPASRAGLARGGR